FQGSLAYEHFSNAAADTVGLNIYDISDPSAFQLVASVSIPVVDPSRPFDLSRLQVQEERVYLEYEESRWCDDMWCPITYRARIEFSDHGNISYEGPTRGVRFDTCEGDSGVWTGGDGYSYISDVADWADPILLAFYEEPVEFWELTFVGDSAF